MASNFQEVMERRNDLLHRWAILQELYDHLLKFVDTDVRKAELGIKTEGEGLVVPQDLIVETRDSIMADMAETMAEIKKLESREVAEYDDEEAEEEDGEEADGEPDADEGPEEAESDD